MFNLLTFLGFHEPCQRGNCKDVIIDITLPQLQQEKARRPQNLSLLNELEPPAPLSLSLAPYI